MSGPDTVVNTAHFGKKFAALHAWAFPRNVRFLKFSQPRGENRIGRQGPRGIAGDDASGVREACETLSSASCMTVLSKQLRVDGSKATSTSSSSGDVSPR
jgi:hypothetical protein